MRRTPGDKVLDTLCDCAREEGEKFFRKAPEAWLIHAAREASQRYNDPTWHPQYHAFMEGFSNARKRHEAYLAEQVPA